MGADQSLISQHLHFESRFDLTSSHHLHGST